MRVDWLSGWKMRVGWVSGWKMTAGWVSGWKMKLKEVDPRILEFGSMALSRSNQEILGAVKDTRHEEFKVYVYNSLKRKQEEGIVRTDISLEVLTNYFMKAYVAISGELVLEAHDEKDIKDYIRLLLDSFKNKEVTNE